MSSECIAKENEMNVKDLVTLLVGLDDDLPIVIEDKKGTKEATHVSLFLNVNGDVVVQIE